jgi:gliding motility-associated peptidyl-prolyl isomerase
MLRNLLILLFGCLAFVSCKTPEAIPPIQRTSGSFIDESVERNKKIFELEKNQFLALMESNPENEYITSTNGFWYYYNKKDTISTVVPTLGDQVTFSYDLTYLNGEVLLSEEEIGIQDYIVDKTKQELISGIRDGIKLMKVGETITLFLPSYKAFGYYGIVNKLGANVPLQSKLTLISINQTQ